MDSNLAFKKISQKLIYSNYREILEKKFQLPDGSLADYEIIHSKTEVVVIVALDSKDNLILVRQFRPGVEKILLEFPGGGCNSRETALGAAKRELIEETGYITDDIIFAGAYHSDSVSDTIFNVFLARNCEKIADQILDKTEFIEVVLMPVSDYEKYFRENQLSAIHLAAFFFAKPLI